MTSFVLGISLTLNIVFIISLFIILKLFVLKSEKKETIKGINEDAIVDKEILKDFWS